MPGTREEALIEEIARVKEALAEERAKLTAILESMVDGVYTTDIYRNITFWNKGAERITGFRSDDVLGKTCRDILAHTDETGKSLCDSSCPLAETMGKRKVISGEVVYSGSASGNVVPVSVSCSPIVEQDGRILGAIEVFRDISEQKALERQKADFNSMITHDLKAPLQVILGYSELLVDRPDMPAENKAEFLRAILRNGQKLSDMIGDFLSASLFESRSMSVNLAPSRIGPVLERLFEGYLSIASKKGVLLKLDVQAPPPESMLDEKLMERAVSNLLSNALKFTPPGGTVTLSSRHEPRALFIAVKDTGPGIPEGEQARVFDMYYRAAASRGAEGTGLGLSVVKAVAEAHGGGVTLKSRPGEGCEFTIRVPLEAAGPGGRAS